MKNATLFDLFRAYPDGVSGLARKSGLSVHMIYRVANGQHRRKPVRALDSIADAFGKLKVLGEQWSLDKLNESWERAHSDHQASV